LKLWKGKRELRSVGVDQAYAKLSQNSHCLEEGNTGQLGGEGEPEGESDPKKKSLGNGQRPDSPRGGGGGGGGGGGKAEGNVNSYHFAVFSTHQIKKKQRMSMTNIKALERTGKKE